MISFQRIEAMVLRHLYCFRRSWDRIADAVYWPVFDLMMWGITTEWLQQSAIGSSPALLAVLTGMVFWQTVWRANYEISVSLLEESWCQNMVNLFVTPISVVEWILSVMCLGMIKVALTLVVGFATCFVLYSVNILTLGYMLVPFLTILILFGWSCGLLAAGLIVRFGRQIQTVAWMMGWLFAPVSAVYYPVSALPEWAQGIAYSIPTTYVFEGMRTCLATGQMPWSTWLQALGMSLVYLIGTGFFFASMFEYRRGIGLARMD